MACFMISRSIPERGVVLAATPLFSPWALDDDDEPEEEEEDCGSWGLLRVARTWNTLQPPEHLSFKTDASLAGSPTVQRDKVGSVDCIAILKLLRYVHIIFSLTLPPAPSEKI